MVSGWTSLQTVFALGAYMFGGPDAFPFKLSKSIEGTVYLTIAFWDMVYLPYSSVFGVSVVTAITR